MRKILLISTNSDEAGAPRHVEQLARLAQKNCQVHVVFGGTGPVYQRLRTEQALTVTSIAQLQSSISLYKDVVTFLKLLYLILTFKPDIIHGHSSKVGFLIRAFSLLGRQRFIFTIHGWSWRGFSPRKTKLYFSLEKFFYKVARCEYIFVSQNTKNEALHLGIDVDKKPNYVIYNSSMPLSSDAAQTARLSETYGDFILMPARVSSAKNHTLIAEAFEKSTYQGRLVFAGEGTDSATFKNDIKAICATKYDDVCFLGEISDIANYMSASTAVCLCSNFEAFPLSLVEAMMLDKKIIASSVGGVPELTGDNQRGLSIPNERDAWVAALDGLTSPEWEQRLQNAKTFYASNLSEETFARRMTELYLSDRP